MIYFVNTRTTFGKAWTDPFYQYHVPEVKIKPTTRGENDAVKGACSDDCAIMYPVY